MGEMGKGVFSTVLKCIDLKLYDENNPSSQDTSYVVLKVVRNNSIMKKSTEKEIQILDLITKNDVENKRHCIKMLSSTEYRNHMVIVFEMMSMNLREIIKKFGKNVGINISAVKMYSKQLLIALRHLQQLHIVHADIKPDNIVISQDLKTVSCNSFFLIFLTSYSY